MERPNWTRLKGEGGLLAGWPEKTNRILIAIVAVALLLGVPILSMTAMSVHVERQVIAIDPESYRAFRICFYGLGEMEYSYSASLYSEAYVLELDTINFYRFSAGNSYEYGMKENMGGGLSSISGAGYIGDKYLVLVNDNNAPLFVDFELHARAFVSLIPTAAILLTVGAAGYALGRHADKEAQLDRTDPVVMARRLVRRKALVAITVLILIPIVMMFAVAAAAPSGTGFGMVADIMGFFLGLLIASVVAFVLQFKLTKEAAPPDQILAKLAYRLRVSGYRVTEKRKRLIVQISNTSAVHITTKKVPGGTWVLYKPSATPNGLSVLIVLAFIFITMPLTLALSLFMLYRASAFASMRVLPRISQIPVPEVSAARVETRTMIVESLSEGRRLSAEAYESARSNYHDSVIIMFVLVTVLSFVLGTLAYGIMDVDQRGKIALAVGVFSGVVISAVLWLLLAAKARPQITEFRKWSKKLDAALSREVAGQSPADGEPSSFELIVDSFKEIPKWLKVRRKAGGYREPLIWLLIFFLIYGAIEVGFMGLLWWVEGRSTAGIVAIAVSIVLVLLSVGSNVAYKKRLDLEQERTLSDWRKRYDSLKSEMEKFLVGE